MTTKDNDFSLGIQTGKGKAKGAARAEQPTQKSPDERPARHVGRGIASLGRRTASSSHGNKTMAEIKSIFDSIAERINVGAVDGHFRTVVVEDPTQLHIPALLVYRLDKATKSAHFFTILIEALGIAVEPIHVDNGVGSGRVRIDRYTAALWDNVMRRVCMDTMARDLAVRNESDYTPRSAFFCVLKRDINVADAENLDGFFDEAVDSILTAEAVANGEPLSLDTIEDYTAPDAEIVNRFRIDPYGRTITPTGDVLHTDFTTTLMVRSRIVDNENVNRADKPFVIAHTAGYLDLAYTTPPSTPVKNQRGMDVLPNYLPVLVFPYSSPTGVGLQSSNNIVTTCLGIALTAVAFADKDRYLTIFSIGKDSDAGPSIGELGWETTPYPNVQHVAEPIAVSKKAAYGDKDSKSVHPLDVAADYLIPGNLQVAIEVVQGSATAWNTGMLLAATRGSDTENLIFEALEQFSGGRFLKYLPETATVLASGVIEKYVGRYPDAQGVMRSLNSVTYLEMLRLCSGDYRVMSAYSAATNPATCTPEALEAYKLIIEQYLPQVEFTGKASMGYLSNAFLTAIAMMCQDPEVDMRIISEGLTEIGATNGRVAMTVRQTSALSGGDLYRGRVGQQVGTTVPNYFNSAVNFQRPR